MKENVKEHLFCKICNIQTELTSKNFTRFHLKKYHKINLKEYYDTYFKKNGEGVCECGLPTIYVSYDIGYRKFCSILCINKSQDTKNKIQETCIERYGVKNAYQSIEIRNKAKNTNLERYGVEHNWNHGKLREELSDRFEQKYGVRTPFESKEILDKAKKTHFDRHGVENPFSLEENKDKIKHTMRRVYGVEHNMYIQSCKDKVKNKLEESSLIRYRELSKDLAEVLEYKDSVLKCQCECNDIFNVTTQMFHTRLRNKEKICCQKCRPYNYPSSRQEKDLLRFIRDNYTGEILSNTKKFIKPQELDIYLPELKIAFEYNGLYWHSEAKQDSKYHQRKSNTCKDNSIDLVHIFQDDWIYKNDKVKDTILRKLNKIQTVDAYKCVIKELSSSTIEDFIRVNSIEELGRYTKGYGLYLNEHLVYVVTLYEACRVVIRNHCDKMGIKVTNDLCRILEHYSNIKKETKIVVYQDRTFGEDPNLKEHFEVIKDITPKYMLISRDVRYSKILVRKLDLDSKKKLLKIFDVGRYKYLYKG